MVKLLVIIGMHSAVRWDQWLYRWRIVHPVTWVVERTISTPATHDAHHALTQDDGIGRYDGNHGNLRPRRAETVLGYEKHLPID